jgi:hypothetical protein
MRRSFFITAILALAVACGSSTDASGTGAGAIGGSPYCDSVDSFVNAWAAKKGNCTVAEPTTPGGATGSSCAVSCAEATAGCTSADKAVIDAWTTCLESASACSAPGTDWYISLAPCLSNAGTLSQACTQAPSGC